MNDAHLHLIINHFPIIIPLVALLVLSVGYLVPSDVVKRVALGLFIVSALFTFPSMFTGDRAEDIVEKMPGITHDIIDLHEDAAETFALFSYLLGCISLLGLWANYKKKSFTNGIILVVILLAFITLYLGKEAGTTGGEIRHTEIRAGFFLPKGDEHQDD